MGLKGINDCVLSNILYLIWEKGITEGDFCDKLSLSKGAVTDWKSGKTASYKRYLSEIAGFFGVTVIDLMNSQFIAVRLANAAPGDAPEAANDSASRVNEFYSFPLEVQQIGLDVMRGIAKNLKGGQ